MNGDIDLADGRLDALRSEYQRRKNQVSLSSSISRDALETRLIEVISAVELDVQFLSEGLKEADKGYQFKFNSPNTSRELLKALCWERVEYSTLPQQAQCLKGSLEIVLPHLNQDHPRITDVLAILKNLKADYLKYVKNVFTKKRQPVATHILVILISEERSSNKPVALPVQYIPYKSMKDQYIRDLNNKVKAAIAL